MKLSLGLRPSAIWLGVLLFLHSLAAVCLVLADIPAFLQGALFLAVSASLLYFIEGACGSQRVTEVEFDGSAWLLQFADGRCEVVRLRPGALVWSWLVQASFRSDNRCHDWMLWPDQVTTDDHRRARMVLSLARPED